jgi:hypothetical protein
LEHGVYDDYDSVPVSTLKMAETGSVIVESDLEIDDRVTEQLNTEYLVSDEPTTPLSGIIPVPEIAATSPIILSTLSSTFLKWAFKVVNNADHQATCQLLGQLARVMPLAGNSSSSSTAMTRNAAFENAQKEAIHGLRKARDTTESVSSGASVALGPTQRQRARGRWDITIAL